VLPRTNLTSKYNVFIYTTFSFIPPFACQFPHGGVAQREAWANTGWCLLLGSFRWLRCSRWLRPTFFCCGRVAEMSPFASSMVLSPWPCHRCRLAPTPAERQFRLRLGLCWRNRTKFCNCVSGEVLISPETDIVILGMRMKTGNPYKILLKPLAKDVRNTKLLFQQSYRSTL